MVKASVFIATGLDGFIARENGDLEWLGEPSDEGEDYGYQHFFDSVDVLVMGRNSFDKVLSFDQWPYADKSVVVLTYRRLDLPAQLPDTIEMMSGSPQEAVEQLEARGFSHLYIDGGQSIQGVLKAGLIQRLIITRIPIILGSGIPLCGPLTGDIKLSHLHTQHFPGGLVQSEYAIRAAP
jgi:dihydrofolate reductase